MKFTISNICIYVFLDVTYDVNKFLQSGWTLLLYAALWVQPEIIKYLLTLDANPNKDKGMYR